MLDEISSKQNGFFKGQNMKSKFLQMFPSAKQWPLMLQIVIAGYPTMFIVCFFYLQGSIFVNLYSSQVK